jgi:hypothetical protein
VDLPPMADKISHHVRCDPALDAAAAGDRQAAADLLSLVYNELRKFAAARLAAEAPGEGATCRREFRENVIFRVL